MSQITFVCCIESGFLEAQTLRLVASLRQYGGKLANEPVLAVIPRFSFPLASETKKILSDLNVQFLHCKEDPQYGWFNYFNKPVALSCAEKIVTTEQICWLDGDMIWTGEPSELILGENEDFAAFPTQFKEMSTNGQADDPYYPLWIKFCEVAGISLDDLPLFKCDETGEIVHLYYNSGIFTYRTKHAFGEKYLSMCRDLLDSNYAGSDKDFGQGIKEQGAVSLCVVKHKINWRPLTYQYNYSFSSQDYPHLYSEEKLRSSCIIHYHDGMWSHFWPIFIKSIGQTHPKVYDWLETLGPMQSNTPLIYRALNKFLSRKRKKKQTAYAAQSIYV